MWLGNVWQGNMCGKVTCSNGGREEHCVLKGLHVWYGGNSHPAEHVACPHTILWPSPHGGALGCQNQYHSWVRGKWRGRLGGGGVGIKQEENRKMGRDE